MCETTQGKRAEQTPTFSTAESEQALTRTEAAAQMQQSAIPITADGQARTEQHAQTESDAQTEQHAQIERIAAELENAEPVTRTEPSPELLALRGKSALSKKEKRLLRAMETQLEDARRREEEAERQRQAQARREEQKRAAEAEAEEIRQAKRALFEKMAEEEERNGPDSPASATSFAALFEAKDKQKAIQTVLALAGHLIERDQSLTDGGLESGSQLIKGHRAVIAEHLRHDKQRARAFSAELETHMQALEDVFQTGLLARVAERELKQIFWEELLDVRNPQSKFMNDVFFSISAQYDREKVEKTDALDDFTRRLSAATGVSESALKTQAKDKRKEAKRLAEELAINEDEALDRMVEAEEAPLAQMSRLRFDAQHSVVENPPEETLLTDGGAFSRLAADEAEAQRLVREANGFLYMQAREDGLYDLKPTIPEQVTIHGRNGEQTEIALRKNYNRLTRLLAMGMLNAEGTSISEHGENTGFATEACDAYGKSVNGTRNPAEELKLLFGTSLPAGLLDVGEDENTVFHDMGVIFAEVLRFETMQGLVGFVEQAREPLKERDDAEYGEARQEARRAYLATHANDLKLPGETDAQYETRSEDALALAENALRNWYDSFAELQTLRTLDIHSRDVFLPGACSANTATVSRMRGYAEGDVSNLHVYTTASDNFIAQRKEYICERLSALTGKPQDAFREMENRQLMKEYGLYSSFEYHQAPGIGQTEDGALLTLECFAATTAQLSVSPFTQHIYMGVYKGDTGFANYYNQDTSAIVTPAERLIDPLRRANLL
ncbi:MAG: hypothetical protein LBS24_02550 [Clostridiales Family XIII bacterium]|jgi:hypothetical protein|nr:hypothetical protein [Clostridiales Family XIII bacterium]